MSSLKYSQQTSSNRQYQIDENYKQSDFIKQLLSKLQVFDDKQQISLQQSIPILYNLNIFQQLKSIPDAKKRLTRQTKSHQRLQLQARFIYNLWKIIKSQLIQMRIFKDLVSLFITEQISKLAVQLEVMFPHQRDSIIQIIAIWEGMLQNRQNHNSHTINGHQCSVLTQRSDNFNTSDAQKRITKKIQNNLFSIERSDKNHSKHHVESFSQNIGKQNQKKSFSSNSNFQTQRQNYNTKRQNLKDLTEQIYSNNFYEIPVLSVEKQKELVNRLYVVNKYDRYLDMKKIKDQQEIQRQMQQCTFHPKIQKKQKKRCQTAGKWKNPTSQRKVIPGFQKAIQRMKIGQQKTKQLRQKLQLRNININISTSEQCVKAMAPPKFLTRELKKEQKKVLFTIQFDIGRHKITCKIHLNQSAEQLAKNIQSIYSLKQQSFQQIKQIIGRQIQRYYELKQGTTQNQHQNRETFTQYNALENTKGNNFIFC